MFFENDEWFSTHHKSKTVNEELHRIFLPVLKNGQVVVSFRLKGCDIEEKLTNHKQSCGLCDKKLIKGDIVYKILYFGFRQNDRFLICEGCSKKRIRKLFKKDREIEDD